MYRGEYQLVGSELSFFSRKLEAQLRYQGIPWQWMFKTEERRETLEKRAATHFIPLLLTPDKWLLHDTIAIGPFLNDRFNNCPVIPATPLQRGACFILEDAFNHWLGRVCVHSRWCYPDNVRWVGPRFAANMMLDRSIEEPFSDEELTRLEPFGQHMLDSFGRSACEFNGVGPDQCGAVQADFANMMKALRTHLTQSEFLLGDRPCLADFALAGACRGHFLCDPEPLSWVGDDREWLTDYTGRCFSACPSPAPQWPGDDALPDSLNAVLDYLQHSYFVSASANIAAGRAGQKFYDYDIGLGNVHARTQKRLNMAREHVRDELVSVGAADHNGLRRTFGSRGILGYYLD